MSRLTESLNEGQLEAVLTTEGPLLVIAGAGSGKTRVLTRRVAHILTERLAEPYQILAVTFTNKAAGEMTERIASLLGSGISDLNVATFHSFCARLLRREAEHIGYTSDFTIYDADDSRTLVKNCLKQLGFSDTQFPHRAQLRKISDFKNQLISSEAFAKQASGYFETRSAQIYSLYEKRLRECRAMDFDDLLFQTVTLLKSNEGIAKKYQQRFHYILVDEYQDTNHVQYMLLKILAQGHGNICVVGDEDQSIYGWRGADIRNILDFEKDFPGAKIIKLEQNYRSSGNILKAASAVISNNEMRKGKTLFTSDGDGEKIRVLMVDHSLDEAKRVIETISNANVPYNNVAILYRTNAQSRPLEEQLRRGGLPYQVFGAVSFYSRKEVKDLLAYLRLLVNPKDDVSFGRVVNYPKRGIGLKTLEQIGILAEQRGCSRYELLLQLDSHPELSGKAKKLQPFVELIQKYHARVDDHAVDIVIQDLVEELGLIQELLNEDPISGQTRVENIEAFVEGIVDYSRSHPEPRLAEYLQEISLFTDLDRYKDDDEKVSLMTIHAAKGLEFDAVYLVGMEEGRFPLQRAIAEPVELEEERRLFYVGMTRARRTVHLSFASVRFQYGDVESIPSRFIREIPKEIIEKRDLRQKTKYDYSTSRPSRPSAPVAPVRPSGESYVEYEEEELIRPGSVVAHPTFGRGSILKVDGFGESLRLEIMFTGVGVKKVLAKYARLKVIG